MPLYVADYLADTSRLTTEQHGAYLLLILDYWRNGSPPDNDEVLRQITKLSPDAWSNAQAMLKSFFDIIDGRLVHHRIEKELLTARKNREFAKERASKAAKTRWGHATSNAPSNQQAMLDECSSPSPSYKNNNTSPSGDQTPIEKPSDTIDYAGIVNLYHKILPELAAVRNLTDKRRKAIRGCCATKPRYSELEFWEAYFQSVRKSNFLMGREKNWMADFDFLVTHSKFIKIIEGAYK